MTDLPEPPYPADTRAKGWRFELDYEQIEQSDTWDLAAEVPMSQHCLLMMWLTAWRQKPCGAFPADEATIRAKCKVPPKIWAQCRDVLMRGWWPASDGLLYHDTIVNRVLEMIDYRRKNAERVAAFKAAKREQQGGNALPASESRKNKDTGTGTGTGTISPSLGSGDTAGAPARRPSKPKPETVEASVLIAAGFDGETAAEFIAHKDRIKAPLTLRAWADHLREAAKAGWTPQAAAEKVMAKTWKGFEAAYVTNESRGSAPAKSFRQQDLEATEARIREMTGGILGNGSRNRQSIDMEAGNGTLAALD